MLGAGEGVVRRVFYRSFASVIICSRVLPFVEISDAVPTFSVPLVTIELSVKPEAAPVNSVNVDSTTEEHFDEPTLYTARPVILEKSPVALIDCKPISDVIVNL